LGGHLAAGGVRRPALMGGVVMHNPDIATLFEQVPEGAMVVFF
jgi:hypothetical protein